MTFDNNDLIEILDTVRLEDLFFVRVVIQQEVAETHNWRDNNEFHNAYFRMYPPSDETGGGILVVNFNEDMSLNNVGYWPFPVIDNWMAKPIKSKDDLAAERLGQRYY